MCVSHLGNDFLTRSFKKFLSILENRGFQIIFEIKLR